MVWRSANPSLQNGRKNPSRQRSPNHLEHQTILTNLPSRLTLTANNPLTFGPVYNGNSYRLPGQIDEARVYNRALGAAELQTLAQARSYSYDAKGNLASDRVWGYQYDYEAPQQNLWVSSGSGSRPRL